MPRGLRALKTNNAGSAIIPSNTPEIPLKTRVNDSFFTKALICSKTFSKAIYPIGIAKNTKNFLNSGFRNSFKFIPSIALLAYIVSSWRRPSIGHNKYINILRQWIIMVKIRGAIANLFTYGNAISGFSSMLFTLNGEYVNAAFMLVLAIVFDGMDGRVARFLDNTSDFGRELDSLSDAISFGAAPALLVYQAYLSDIGPLGVAACAFVVAGGITRLARFNLLKGLGYFVGLPIPVVGVFLASLVYTGTAIAPKTLAVVMILLSYLMISKVRYPSFKQNVRSKNFAIFLLFFAVLLAIVFTTRPDKALVAPFLFYIVAGPVIELKSRI